MSHLNWPEALREALVARRLPLEYQERFMDELLDHCADLMEENPDMNAITLATRMGSPDALAAQAAETVRRRTFGGRHPVLTFILAPIPLVVGAIIAVVFVAAIPLELLGSFIPENRRNSVGAVFSEALFLEAFCWTVRILPFALAAWWFCRSARRAGLSWRWPVAACALIAFLAAAFAIQFRMPTGIPNTGALTIGLSFPPFGSVVQWGQCLTPLAIVAWQLRTAAQMRRDVARDGATAAC